MTEFNLSRRGFLKAAIAGATAAAIASPVFALVKDEFISKIERLIVLHDELVAMINPDAPLVSVKYPNGHYSYRHALHVSVEDYDAKFNELLSVVNTLDVPKKGTAEHDQAKVDVAAVFSREDSRSFRDIPPTLCPAAIGVSVVRSLLSEHRLRMNPENMSEFGQFADKYQSLIIGD